MRHSAWKILAAAAVLGIAGDSLMRGGMLRLGFVAWIALLALLAVALGGLALGAIDQSGRSHTERLLLIIGTVVAAGGLVLRDSPTLYAVDMLSVFCMGALTIWHGSGKRIRDLTVIEAIRAALLAVINSIGGALGVLQQVRLDRDPEHTSTGRTRAVVIGVILAIPPLVVVTALLSSSDAIFEHLIDHVVTFLEVDGIQHVLMAVVLAWISAGWLRAALGRAIASPQAEIRSPSLPFLSVGIGLYALVTLLSLFLVTQLRVLFGGEEFLRTTAGLTVATYAREGFFQLILAAGVVLGTLIVADWLLGTDDRAARRHFRLAGSTLLLLVALLLASAATRMWLYLREFGLSIDRAFACAVMVWVVAALVVFAATMLRGRAERFAPSVLITTIVWVVALNVANLEAIVVRTNIARAMRGESFDAEYHANLSGDALPTLLAGAPKLQSADCELLRSALSKRWTTRFGDTRDAGGDWRAVNVPIVRAKTWLSAGATLCAP